MLPNPSGPGQPGSHRPSVSGGTGSQEVQVTLNASRSLPPMLQPGGPLDAVLRRPGSEGPEPSAVHQLRNQLVSDLEKLGEMYRVPFDPIDDWAPRLPPAKLYAYTLERSMGRWEATEPADPVLRYSIAVAESLEEASSRLHPAAREEYLRQPDAYDAVLGTFIPADFRDDARRHLAGEAYRRGSNVTAADDWAVYRAGRQARGQRVTVGLAGVDGALGGGLAGLTFLGGPPGVGKTTLALAAALAALRRHPDVAVLFYSLDMAKDVLFDRILCHEAGLDYRALFGDGHAGEAGLVLPEVEERLLRDTLPRLRVLERAALCQGGKPTAEVLRRHRRELLEKTGASRVLIVLDYLQKLEVPDTSPTSLDADYRRVELLQQVQDASRTPSRPLGDPVLAISEVRKGEPTGTAADLLGSTRLGYAADAVLLLDPADGGPAPGTDTVPVTLTIAKGRDGITRAKIPLLFEHTRCRFREPDGAAGQKGVSPRTPGAKKDPLAGGRED